MTLTLLPALQHGLLDMLFQCYFCGWNVLNWLALLCKQELATLIHRNTWNSYFAQENNKSLNTLKISIGCDPGKTSMGQYFLTKLQTLENLLALCCR